MAILIEFNCPNGHKWQDPLPEEKAPGMAKQFGHCPHSSHRAVNVLGTFTRIVYTCINHNTCKDRNCKCQCHTSSPI